MIIFLNDLTQFQFFVENYKKSSKMANGDFNFDCI